MYIQLPCTLPLLFTFGFDSYYFVIPVHCHLLDVAATSLIVILLSTNQHKAFISPLVKICTQLIEKN